MLQDTLAVVTPTTGSELILYWVTLLAGAASGYAVKGLDKVKVLAGKLNEFLKLGVVAGLSFLGLQFAVYFGLALPDNPLSWDPIAVNTALSTVLGYVVSKTGLVKKTS